MQHVYGKAVVEERATPSRHREIATYLRREYEPGTGPGYLLAAPSAVAPRGAVPGETGRAARAFVASVGKLVPWWGALGRLGVEGDRIRGPAERAPEECAERLAGD